MGFCAQLPTQNWNLVNVDHMVNLNSVRVRHVCGAAAHEKLQETDAQSQGMKGRVLLRKFLWTKLFATAGDKEVYRGN